MNKSEVITNLAKAVSGAQGEFRAVKFDSTNPFLKNHFASLGALIDHTRPILAKYGLAVSQLSFGEGGVAGVETILLHSSGEWISNSMAMQVGEEKGKSTAQVAGSIITYLRRYSYASILGLYADEDGDGNKPAGNHTEPEAQPEPARQPLMTVEEAVKVQNSEGVPYGNLSTDKLMAMTIGVRKALKAEHPDAEREVYQRKLEAINVILKARQSGEIAQRNNAN